MAYAKQQSSNSTEPVVEEPPVTVEPEPAPTTTIPEVLTPGQRVKMDIQKRERKRQEARAKAREERISARVQNTNIVEGYCPNIDKYFRITN